MAEVKPADEGGNSSVRSEVSTVMRTPLAAGLSKFSISARSEFAVQRCKLFHSSHDVEIEVKWCSLLKSTGDSGNALTPALRSRRISTAFDN